MMRLLGPCIAAIAMLICAGPAGAALLYDMNGPPPPSGFGPNGFPGTPTITQDTIGATVGPNSMKFGHPWTGRSSVRSLELFRPL